MKNDSKILSIKNAKTKELVKADQAKLKGGYVAEGWFGCPPPVGGSALNYQ